MRREEVPVPGRAEGTRHPGRFLIKAAISGVSNVLLSHLLLRALRWVRRDSETSPSSSLWSCPHHGPPKSRHELSLHAATNPAGREKDRDNLRRDFPVPPPGFSRSWSPAPPHPHGPGVPRLALAPGGFGPQESQVPPWVCPQIPKLPLPTFPLLHLSFPAGPAAAPHPQTVHAHPALSQPPLSPSSPRSHPSPRNIYPVLQTLLSTSQPS